MLDKQNNDMGMTVLPLSIGRIERCSQEVSTPASYFGGSGSNLVLETSYTDWGFRGFLSPSRQMLG
jgi:hypothetical protein